MKFINILLIAAIIGIIAFSGCINEDKQEKKDLVSEKESDYKIVTDMRGKEVKIPKNPERVVAISNSFIEELMLVFDVEDKLVGYGGMDRKNSAFAHTNKFSPNEIANDEKEYFMQGTYVSVALYPEITNLTNVGSWWNEGINYETLASLNPDIVIFRTWGLVGGENEEKTIDKIESLGFPVIVINDPDYYDMPDVKTINNEIEVVGVIFDKQHEAERLINKLNAETNFIKERTSDIPDNEKPEILYFGLSGEARDAGGAGIVSGGNSIYTDVIVDIVNAKNAYNGIGSNVVLSTEQVLALNPDVILLPTWHGYHPPRELYESSNYNNLQGVSAVKEKRVASLAWTPQRSMRLEYPIDLMIAAKWAYPERFNDINVSEWVDKYYKEIYSVDDAGAEKLKTVQMLNWLDDEVF